MRDEVLGGDEPAPPGAENDETGARSMFEHAEKTVAAPLGIPLLHWEKAQNESAREWMRAAFRFARDIGRKEFRAMVLQMQNAALNEMHRAKEAESRAATAERELDAFERTLANTLCLRGPTGHFGWQGAKVGEFTQSGADIFAEAIRRQARSVAATQPASVATDGEAEPIRVGPAHCEKCGRSIDMGGPLCDSCAETNKERVERVRAEIARQERKPRGKGGGRKGR